jgi:large subunit ribosomal protein L15
LFVEQDADHLTTAVRLEVTEASQAAIAAIEAKGGSVVTVYHSALSLRALLHPHKFDIVPKTPAPPPKSMPYYLSDENRGYLSRLVQLKALQKSA